MGAPEEVVVGDCDDDEDDTESTSINLNTSSFSMKKLASDEAVDVIFIVDYFYDDGRLDGRRETRSTVYVGRSALPFPLRCLRSRW